MRLRKYLNDSLLKSKNKKIKLPKITKSIRGDTPVKDLKVGDIIDRKFTDYSKKLEILKIIKSTPKMITFKVKFPNKNKTFKKSYRITSTVDLSY